MRHRVMETHVNIGKSAKILKLVYIFLLGYISLLPFYYFPSINYAGLKLPIIRYLPLFLILFLLAVSSLKGYISIRDAKQGRLNRYIIFYFCLTLLGGIGTKYFSISILKAIYYGLTSILIYFVIYSWRLNKIKKLWILRNIVILGFIVSAYGIITLLLGKDLLFGGLEYNKNNLTDANLFLGMGRISSSLGNPLFLSGFLSAIFPISVYLHLLNTELKNLPRYLTAIMPITIFAAIILTFSVGAFLGIIVFYVFYCVTIKKIYRSYSAAKITEALLALGIFLLCIILFMMAANLFLRFYNKDYIFGEYFNRINFHKLANIDGVALRLDNLRYAVDFLNSPSLLFGIGIGRIGTNTSGLPRVSIDNYFFLSLIETGILATAVMLTVFYLIIKKAYNKLKIQISWEEKSLSIFFISSFIIFFVNMLFWDVFNHPTMRILFWSFVGFLV
jgi:hypothetical protein